MDVLRRNTDYALRAMVHLARHWQDGPVSTSEIAESEEIYYQLACKLMQRLQKAGLVASTMGAKGGFTLSRQPAKISLAQVIEAVQGKIHLNRCLIGGYKCPREAECPVYKKLTSLQSQIDSYFAKINLAELIKTRPKKSRKGKKK